VIGVGASTPLMEYRSAVAIIFPSSFVVFDVAQNPPNENLMAFVVDPTNQSATIAAYIKNDTLPNLVRTVPSLSDIQKVPPLRFLSNRVASR
jgi:hypothetical protein